MIVRRITSLASVICMTAVVTPSAAEPAVAPSAGAAAADTTAGDATADAGALSPEQQAEEETRKKMEAFVASLELRSGDVTLGNDLAVLHVPPSFRFTGAQGAERVLQAWGNPPGSDALGMLFPAEMSPLDEKSWGVVVSYVEEGHVEDDDAEDIDFDDLLEQMQEETEAANAERKKTNFGTVHLVKWAEPPHYDAATHKLYWAKALDFEGNSEHTLNYAIRVLGRKGVLEFNAVSEIKRLPEIRTKMKDVLGFAEFKQGSRYADFDPDLDEVAAYGIGGLIAGKLALKAGLFKGLIALLVAGKKFLVVGVIALGALGKALWSRRRAKAEADAG
jgi:uncharacterized membrane-anchored protein